MWNGYCLAVVSVKSLQLFVWVFAEILLGKIMDWIASESASVKCVKRYLRGTTGSLISHIATRRRSLGSAMPNREYHCADMAFWSEKG